MTSIDITIRNDDGETTTGDIRSLPSGQDIERLKAAAYYGIVLPVSDHRDNPGLHRMHVLWAQENLQIINDALDRMNEVSQVPMSLASGALFIARRQMIEGDTAYQEAAWRIMAGCLLEEKGL